MKLLGLCLLALTIAQTYSLGHQIEIEVGKTYLYGYKGYTVSGVALSNNERTGLAIWTDVLVTVKSEDRLLVQLQNPTIRQIYLNSTSTLPVDKVPHVEAALERENEFRPLPQHLKRKLTEFIEKPVELVIQRGRILEILALEDEPQSILTLKSGIFHQFQLPKLTSDIMRITQDTLVGKDCEIDFDVMTPSEDSKNAIITSKFSLDSCKEPIVHDDLLRFANEPRKDNGQQNLKSSFVTIYNVTRMQRRPFVNDWVTEGRYTLSIFKPKHGEVSIYTRQQMRFVKIEDKKIETTGLTLVRHRDTITAPLAMDKTMHSDLPEDTKLELIESLFNEIIETIENENEATFEIEMTEKFALAVDMMNRLVETESFTKIAEMATKKENKLMRRMIVTALSNCHSSAMVKSLVTFETILTTGEMNTIITTLGVNGLATTDLIHDLKSLYVHAKQYSVKDQTLLAIGSQIFQLCRPFKSYGLIPVKRNLRTCSEGFQAEFMNMFRQEYVYASESRRVIVLKAIGNSGLEMAHTLEQIFNSEHMSMELRVNAIYAMRRNLDVVTVMKHLLPLFRKFSTPVELRIAAFNTLIDVEPTEEMLVSLVSHLNEEESMQLGNYIYSYLDSLVQIPTIFSATKNLTLTAQTLLPTVERFEDGFWYSQNRQYFLTRLGLTVFRHLETSFITTPEQAIPRSFLMRLTREYCGYFMNVIEMGVRLEGADTYLQELYEKLFAPEMLETYPMHIRSYMKDLTRLHQIIKKGDLTFRSTEKPEGHIFFKVLGNELGIYRLDENTLIDFGNQVFDELMTLGKNRIFDIQSLFPAQLKAQTPMGVTMFSDVLLISMTSLHTDDSTKAANKDVMWAKDITLRNLIKLRHMFGVNLGPLDTAIGSCKHLKLVLPHTWEISTDSETGKLTTEVYWNVDDPMYKSDLVENFELVQFAEFPINYFVSVDTDKKEIDLRLGEVILHPLMKVTEDTYNFDFVGHKLTLIQHERDFTFIQPAYPYDGRHILTLSFYDQQVKPFGLKLDMDLTKTNDIEDFEVTLNITLNPRVAESTEKLSLTLRSNLNKDEDITTSDFALEVLPVWMKKGTYKIFFTTEAIKGRKNPVLSWLEAGEDINMETVFALQYGWNIEFNKDSQDVLFKYRLGKSDLQKFFEEEDLTLKKSDCFKCETIKEESGVWANLFCERCLLKRQTPSRKEYMIFVNNKKVGSEWVEKIIARLDRSNERFFNMLESFEQEWVTPKLINLESDLVDKYMSTLTVDDICAFMRIEDVHPYYTYSNITTEKGNKHLRWTHVPLMPARRRLDNLPLDRLTDVWMQREQFQTRGVCHLDGRNMVKTMDEVIYDITKWNTDCERILAKDCSKDQTFTISVTNTTLAPRILNVKMGDSLITVTPTEDSFTIKVDSTLLPLKKETVEEFVYEMFEDDLISGVVLEVETPEEKKVKELHLNLRDIFTKIVLVEKYVKIEVPFWYKNKICGLCGDFNTEQIMEYKLPNLTVAPDMKSFIEAYSSDKCETKLH